jgi:hypothetical protein
MVTARYAGPGTCESRSLTIAFLLTSSERERIDRLARNEGISTSEFARRAVLGGARVSARALGEAREHGREEMRQQITALEEELVRTRKLVADWRQNARELYAQLERAPNELLATAQQVVVGVPGSQAALAIYWSRIGCRDRSEILPIVAAVVAEDLDRAMRELPVNLVAIYRGWDLLGRVAWLMDVLTVESGHRMPTLIANDVRNGRRLRRGVATLERSCVWRWKHSGNAKRGWTTTGSTAPDSQKGSTV